MALTSHVVFDIFIFEHSINNPLQIRPPAIDVLVRVRELTKIPSAEKIREVMSREVIGFWRRQRQKNLVVR